MALVWSFVPKTYVATILGSKRIPKVLKELERVGLREAELNLQTPIDPDKQTLEARTISCTDNHLQIYRKALAGGYPYILVLEDDVYFSRPSASDLAKVAKFVTSSNWDFLYIGHFPWKIGDKVDKFPGIYRSISWCTHAYFISRSGMEKMLEKTPRQIMNIARKEAPFLVKTLFKESGGIDTYMICKASQGKLESFCLYPMLAYQYSISGWETKAKVAEYLAYWFGFWPVKIFMLCILVVFLFWYLWKRKRKAE